MHFVEPRTIPAGSKRTVYAANQPPYCPLPVTVDSDGLVMTELELTADDVNILVQGGRVRLWVQTFGQPLQPLRVEAVHVAQLEQESAVRRAAELVLESDTVVVDKRLLRPLTFKELADLNDGVTDPRGLVYYDGQLYRDEGPAQ